MKRLIALALACLTLSGCSSSGKSVLPSTLPSPLVSANVGPYQFVAQKALEGKFSGGGANSLISSGKLYTIRSGATVEGSMQVTVFKSSVDGQDAKVQKGILNALGAGGSGFQTIHYGLVRLLATRDGETNLYVWFPGLRNVMEIFVLRNGFTDAGNLVRAVIAGQLGYTAPALQGSGT